ncbi:ATP-binding protein [Rhodoferax sp.]|jgi:light-regulated signal transduction histidine kinase (bacteriophytochrome)|uniref:ATP-binding protein n=1 Tax=Rhodoferax sp. TaxID=50421 RepID=UPI003782EC4D
MTSSSHKASFAGVPPGDTVPWAGGPYSIKRHGTSLTQCDREPVQTPGCIQAHGVLVAVRLADMAILQISENAHGFFGVAAQALLGAPLEQVVGATNLQRLRNLLALEALERNAVYAFTMPVLAVPNAALHASPLDVCAHTLDGTLLLEFEATSRTGALENGDFFSRVTRAVGRLQSAVGVRAFCQQVADEVQAITGLDRVMVYKFHADNHGEVVAESKRADLPAYLGLHYPEADIPQPARDIYQRIWIRPLPDATGPLVEMVPLAHPDTGQPLNMTHCALRGASVMYTEYLANMGVAASLTMPILIEGKLWGLIACHHMTPAHFTHQLRSACELLAQVASLQLKATERVEQLAYRVEVDNVHRKMLVKAAREGDLLALSDSEPSLLDAIDAEGAALYHRDRWWCAGNTPTVEQLDALAQWLNARHDFDSSLEPAYVTDSLARDYTGGPDMAHVASGVIAVRVSRLRRDLILWFRPETLQTVRWAGNPDEKPLVPGPHGMRLSPRHSFELFLESVRGRSLPWSPLEVDSALRLRQLVMELVIAQTAQLTERNVDLTASNEELDAFAYVASHDLKEPLRGINRYAHQLLENAQTMSKEDHQRIDSLMRLTQRMDSLLNSLLHFSRVGRTNLEFETVNLNELVEDTLEMIGVRPEDNSCCIHIPKPLPTIECNPVRVREIFANLISNAIKYNTHAQPLVELTSIAPDDALALRTAPPQARGQIIYCVRDDGIGIEQRHFDQIFRMFKRLHGRDAFGGGMGAGLTVVQKVVQRHGGAIWLESTVGVGSCFYFTLPGTHKASQEQHDTQRHAPH